MRLLWPFTIPGAAASAQRRYGLVAPPGTLTLAAHPMALPAASRSALTTPPIDTLSPLAPDLAWHYDEVMSYVELNMKPPRAYALGILHFFSARGRSGRFGCEGRALCELRPSPTVVGYGRRRSGGPPFVFIYGLTAVVFCEGG